METQFDINAIIALKIREARPTRFEWAEARPEKRRWFGLCIDRALPAGWLDPSCWSGKRYTEEEILGYDYIMIDGKPHNRPHVTAYLSHEYQVTKTFNSNAEAHAWADDLRTRSKKEFEIVKNY
jgi:hypothetical protein